LSLKIRIRNLIDKVLRRRVALGRVRREVVSENKMAATVIRNS
jgi:hypothetical protein